MRRTAQNWSNNYYILVSLIYDFYVYISIYLFIYFSLYLISLYLTSIIITIIITITIIIIGEESQAWS